MLKGYLTYIVAAVMMIVSGLAYFGIDIPGVDVMNPEEVFAEGAAIVGLRRALEGLKEKFL